MLFPPNISSADEWALNRAFLENIVKKIREREAPWDLSHSRLELILSQGKELGWSI